MLHMGIVVSIGFQSKYREDMKSVLLKATVDILTNKIDRTRANPLHNCTDISISAQFYVVYTIL